LLYMLRYARMLVFSEGLESLYMHRAEYPNIYIVIYSFMLRYAYMHVFLEVVEYLYMSIAK
jgi:hypothetical protein